MNSEKKIFSVSEVNSCIKGILEGVPFLNYLSVAGEISNWKKYDSGVFFDLKDKDGSILPCTFWGSSLSRLSFSPSNGDQVIANGKITVYAKKGRYNFNVNYLEKEGQGSALLALEALKKKLAAEGLFDEKRKREIPSFPSSVGIICGRNSAAESDLLRNLSRRWPLLDIYVFYAVVQGEKAPKSLASALERASLSPIDTLIIARGGGSSEDLSAFNDEEVVRKLAAFPKPTISAVGHEIDVTLVDFVSDYRVSTPTGAAEKATPDIAEIKEDLLDEEGRLKTSLSKTLGFFEEKLKSLSSRPFFKNPEAAYEEKSKSLDSLKNRLTLAMTNKIEKEETHLKNAERNLKSISPNSVVSRGYRMLLDAEGNVISSAKKAKIGQKFKAIMKDGKITGEVIAKGE